MKPETPAMEDLKEGRKSLVCVLYPELIHGVLMAWSIYCINLFPNQQKFQDDASLRIARNLSVQPAYLFKFKSSGSGQLLDQGPELRWESPALFQQERSHPTGLQVSLQMPLRCSLGTRV